MKILSIFVYFSKKRRRKKIIFTIQIRGWKEGCKVIINLAKDVGNSQKKYKRIIFGRGRTS